uniref:Uncharacterized protein n=1 Tax=Octopus bimaculoides TaxID=37653 RepID=A0A0L8G1H7_OCTBM
MSLRRQRETLFIYSVISNWSTDAAVILTYFSLESFIRDNARQKYYQILDLWQDVWQKEAVHK